MRRTGELIEILRGRFYEGSTVPASPAWMESGFLLFHLLAYSADFLEAERVMRTIRQVKGWDLYEPSLERIAVLSAETHLALLRGEEFERVESRVLSVVERHEDFNLSSSIYGLAAYYNRIWLHWGNQTRYLTKLDSVTRAVSESSPLPGDVMRALACLTFSDLLRQQHQVHKAEECCDRAEEALDDASHIFMADVARRRALNACFRAVRDSGAVQRKAWRTMEEQGRAMQGPAEDELRVYRIEGQILVARAAIGLGNLDEARREFGLARRDAKRFGLGHFERSRFLPDLERELEPETDAGEGS